MASVLLLLLAALHTFGFRQFGGLFFSIFLVFAAALAWQLGSLPRQGLAVMRRTASWGLVLSFAGVTIEAFRYAFLVPIVLLILVLMFLTAAALLSEKPAER
jgi:hypothetical protein